MSSQTFKIGTRRSPLALRQAEIVKDSLVQAHPDLPIEIVPIHSTADWKKSDGEKPLSEENGGKGLFAKEIEAAILKGDVDCGVHSLKDMSSFLPDALAIEHFLPRQNPHDAFISQKYRTLSDLPKGAPVGSCSARRKSIVLSQRPDLNVVPFRGNVQTRLDKVKAGQVDATFLAMAGLERLGIEDNSIHALTTEEMLPACGQGIICMEIRHNDRQTRNILDKVHCLETGFCAFAEREVLRILDGSCQTPIAAFAKFEGETLSLSAEVYSLDGAQVFKERKTDICQTAAEAVTIGRAVGTALQEILPEGILS